MYAAAGHLYLANELHTSGDLARAAGSGAAIVAVCAVIGFLLGYASSSEDPERGENAKHAMLGGAVLGFLLAGGYLVAF